MKPVRFHLNSRNFYSVSHANSFSLFLNTLYKLALHKVHRNRHTYLGNRYMFSLLGNKVRHFGNYRLVAFLVTRTIILYRSSLREPLSLITLSRGGVYSAWSKMHSVFKLKVWLEVVIRCTRELKIWCLIIFVSRLYLVYSIVFVVMFKFSVTSRSDKISAISTRLPYNNLILYISLSFMGFVVLFIL